MSIKEGNIRITVTYTNKEYASIKLIAARENIAMSELVRRYSNQGINGKLSVDNLDILVPVIREQLSSLLNPAIERLSSISAKTCVQAGAAAYLSAEALSQFVPLDRREDFEICYIEARKKAVKYLKSKISED